MVASGQLSRTSEHVRESGAPGTVQDTVYIGSQVGSGGTQVGGDRAPVCAGVPRAKRDFLLRLRGEGQSRELDGGPDRTDT